MKILTSDKTLGCLVPNIALLLQQNARCFSGKIIFQEREGEKYSGITWKKFYDNVLNISANLREFGFQKGDKLVIYSPNRLEMLELELAVIASGGISVPIFAFFNSETAELLIKHSGAKFLAVAGEIQLKRINLSFNRDSIQEEAGGKLPLKNIFVFDTIDLSSLQAESPYKLNSFSELLKHIRPNSTQLLKGQEGALCFDAREDEICLNMYTSGTMGIPKCVQLSHKNILSQQAGLVQIWNLDENDRFLSYLPWHHSFGGIFERFSALYNGATIFLESSHGKDVKEIFENWKLVQPTVFFSVPKVYQSLIELAKSNKEAEELFFHSGLKFIFTAAAALPKSISIEFEKRGVPVIEGWGLTETSPCCTLTDPNMNREPGVVGKPIPGVAIRIADDGEIQVKGPNVMQGYYNNKEANSTVFTMDGWYCTGDIGEITSSGLKLISRKDRIFKLTNGEKVIPSEMETLIQSQCHYISFAMIVGGGEEYPVALLFPNRKELENPSYEISPEEGCFCPRSLNELGKCLHGCLQDANWGLTQKFSKIRYAMVIDDELSIEKNTLTPSMKVAPKKVVEVYKAHIENLYGAKNKVREDVYIVRLDIEDKCYRALKV